MCKKNGETELVEVDNEKEAIPMILGTNAQRLLFNECIVNLTKAKNVIQQMTNHLEYEETEQIYLENFVGYIDNIIEEYLV